MSGPSASRRADQIDNATAPTDGTRGAILSPSDAAYLKSLAPPTPSAYHRLNPLTKATAATVATLAAFVLGGYIGPAAILIVGVIPGAIAAGVVVKLTRFALLISLPIAVSVALVSIFTRAGERVLFVIGPFDATVEGVDFAGQIMVRLFVVAMALGLFGFTTNPRSLVIDLERRGIPPRLAFAAAATLETIPAMIERAATIQAAQRARGLDTEGSLRARLRGVMPLIGPVILTSLTEVEERSLALEVRAFGKPGRRDLLWTLPDSSRQRLVRWLLLGGLVAVIAARVTGMPPGIV